MKSRYFADSFFYLAFFNIRDRHHQQVVHMAQQLEGTIVTTDVILLELADAFCEPDDREEIGRFIRQLWVSSEVEVVEITRELLQRGLTLFESRRDKDWSLTDCISLLSGGSGAYVNVSLQVNAGAKTGASTSLTLAQASLYDQYGQDLSWNHTVKTTNGKFTVAEFAPSTPTGLKATVDGKTVYIQWQANSETNLDHYNLYVGYSSKNYDMTGSPFNVGNITSLTAPDVPEGIYYLALSAVNSNGQESSLSEEIKVVVGAKPSITISSNASSYVPGDTLSLSFSLSNPTATTQIVDVFLGIVAPDGSIYFFDYSSFILKLVPARVDDSRTFTPAKTSFELSPGYDFPLTPFFSMTLPTGLPEGTYQAFAALAEPGSVQAGSPKIMGEISISSFTYSP